MIDFHTHILPGIDDGSRTVEESIQMLQNLKNQGVEKVIATPHFYPDDTIETFLSKRDRAYRKLKESIQIKIDEGKAKADDFPDIKLGAEVLLGADTANQEGLEKLGIGDSTYILIEMPYSKWSKWMYQAVETIGQRTGLIPLMAHIDRYYDLVGGMEPIDRLFEINVKGQINLSAMQSKHTYRIAKKIVRRCDILGVGSDTHRVRHTENIRNAYQKYTKINQSFLYNLFHRGKKQPRIL